MIVKETQYGFSVRLNQGDKTLAALIYDIMGLRLMIVNSVNKWKIIYVSDKSIEEGWVDISFDGDEVRIPCDASRIMKFAILGLDEITEDKFVELVKYFE